METRATMAKGNDGSYLFLRLGTYGSAITLVPPRPFLLLQTGQRGSDGLGKSGGTDLIVMEEKVFLDALVVGYAGCFFILFLNKNSKNLAEIFFYGENIPSSTGYYFEAQLWLWVTYNDKIFLSTFKFKNQT